MVELDRERERKGERERVKGLTISPWTLLNIGDWPVKKLFHANLT